MKTNIRSSLSIFLLAVTVCAPAQSSFRDLMDTASATMDAARESREQNAAAADIRAIFAKAKEAEDDGNVIFCGFYVGMSKIDADALVAYYGLKDGEWEVQGDPVVYRIRFSLKSIRRITKGGNTFDELLQAVANRVGTMKPGENKSYRLETIDGIVVGMGERYGCTMSDSTGNFTREAERKAAESRASQLDSLPEVESTAAAIIADMVQIPGKEYKMGKTEVTQAQWEAIMGGNPSLFKGMDNPVDQVSWYYCQDFLKLLNSVSVVKDSGLVFRLPTNAEWEYACHAGDKGDYCRLADGTQITKETLGRVAWTRDNSDEKSHPVGQKIPNAFGLYDMHGNVREWCLEEQVAVDALFAKGKAWEHNRVCRGGSWDRSGYGLCSVDLGIGSDPMHGWSDIGFRLCASIASSSVTNSPTPVTNSSITTSNSSTSNQGGLRGQTP